MSIFRNFDVIPEHMSQVVGNICIYIWISLYILKIFLRSYGTTSMRPTVSWADWSRWGNTNTWYIDMTPVISLSHLSRPVLFWFPWKCNRLWWPFYRNKFHKNKARLKRSNYSSENIQCFQVTKRDGRYPEEVHVPHILWCQWSVVVQIIWHTLRHVTQKVAWTSSEMSQNFPFRPNGHFRRKYCLKLRWRHSGILQYQRLPKRLKR